MNKMIHLFLLFSFISSVYGKTIIEDGASDFYTIKKFQEGNEIEVEVFDLKGTKLSAEKIIIENDVFKSYSWRQLQTGDKVDLELKDHALHFKSDDKKKTIKFSNAELKKIVLPPLLTNSLIARIKNNPDAKKFELIVIVPDKMMTLEFNFEKKSFDKIGEYAAFSFWMPDNRRIIYAINGKIMLTDSQTKKTHAIEIPNNDVVRLARITKDGKTLYFSVFNTESDIWLLDLTQE